MKVCFYAGEGIVFEPVSSAVREVFVDALKLGGEGFAKWKKAIADSEKVLVHLAGGEALALMAIGMAEALEKRVVILCPVREAVPGQLSNRATVVHGWNIEFLKSELKKLRDTVEGANDGEGTAADKFQNLFGDLLKQHGYEHKGTVELEGTVFTLREQEMDLALVQEMSHRAKELKVRVRLL